ncbi:hypothetical protein RJ640_022233 [Escallonia rubra]|uniref:RING-type domain-containing protein n=1 Tax=Escallonia rubra TaxID=112253 RepID=A0AA88QJB5_9ASTE|nr:hypothetical protein RJ640_022233 [Escallonia rubra]
MASDNETLDNTKQEDKPKVDENTEPKESFDDVGLWLNALLIYRFRKPRFSWDLLLMNSVLQAHSLKKNIGLFSGFVWVENEEDLSAKLLEFLESPYATTDTLLADKEKVSHPHLTMLERLCKVEGLFGLSVQLLTTLKVKSERGGPQLVNHKFSRSRMPAAETPAKDSQAGKKRKRSSKVEEDEVEPSESKDDFQENDSDAEPKIESEQEDNQSEEEGEEEEEEVKPKMELSSEKSSSKKNVKKDSWASEKGADADGASGSTSRTQVSSTKKQKVEKVSEKDERLSAKDKASSKKQPSKSSTKFSFKDQGKGKIVKKAKAEPTKEEMNAVVVNILKEVDFNTATLSDILRQLRMCSICLEELGVGVEIARTPCFHAYHQDCILNCLKTSNLCPLCRSAMSSGPSCWRLTLLAN